MSQDGVGPKGSMQQPSQHSSVHPSQQPSQHPSQQPAPDKKASVQDKSQDNGEEKEEPKKKGDPVKAPVGDKEVDFKNISLEEAFDILKVLILSSRAAIQPTARSTVSLSCQLWPASAAAAHCKRAACMWDLT